MCRDRGIWHPAPNSPVAIGGSEGQEGAVEDMLGGASHDGAVVGG